MRPGRSTHVESLDSTQESLIARAQRLRSKGETRKAIVAFREACLRDDRNAALWTSYGALLASTSRRDDAAVALLHALWLRRRSHDDLRVRSTQMLLDRLSLPTAA
jgi:Flp pilus assembly protein TadD